VRLNTTIRGQILALSLLPAVVLAIGFAIAAQRARIDLTSAPTRITLGLSLAFGLIVAGMLGRQVAAAVNRRTALLLEHARRLAAGEAFPESGGGTDDRRAGELFRDFARLLEKRTADLERYRLLADGTRDLLLFARARDGRIVHANAAALSGYGYSLEAIGRLTIGDLQAGSPPPGSDPAAYEANQRRSDGTVFPGDVTVETRLIGGELLQLRIVRDITERKRAEALVAEALGAARSAARAKSEFLATMSHEIRTPMNAVIGMTELVLGGQLTDDQREALQIVSDSGTALLRIIDDVLDFSKIEAGKLAVEMIEFPFAKTIESVAMTLAAQARAKGLALTVFADPRAPATLYGDAGRIRQVLTNLVGNAIKFTHAGSVALYAEVSAATKDWCEVRFSIADTGIGIAKEQLERIFEPFAQADASTTRLYGGSGLGLSICHQLVELMGGQLRADSVPGRGSTFSFGLRLRAGESSAAIERHDLRALVVQPPGETACELTRYLSAWGLDVHVVGSRPAVLAAFARAAADGRPFDVAILDAELLGSDAFALSASLAADPRYATARRILIAGHDADGRGAEAVAAGFGAYLVRPLRQSTLFDCILNVAPVPASPRIQAQAERSGLRILLAEDNMINQRVALQQLYKLGHEATVVDTGRAALAAVIAEHYDVILMDCFMPEMDGYAATSAIRRHQSRTGEHTPIVAMTANAQAEDRDTCIAAGMDDYIAKPVTLDALRAVLDGYRRREPHAAPESLAVG
jgi:PAS domain S-box-containing protein